MDIFDMRSPLLYEGDYVPSVADYYYRWFPLEYTMEAHRHRQVEMMYVEQGKCLTEVEGQRLPMAKDEFVLINGNVAHRLLVEKGNSCRILNIEFVFEHGQDDFFSFGSFCKKAFNGPLNIFDTSPCYHLLTDNGEIYGVLKKLVTELDGKGETAQVSVNLLFWQLMLQIQRILEDKRLSAENPQAVYVQKAIGHMQNSYQEDIDVEDIADALGLNRSYFHRLFKEYTGTTPVAFLTDIRMTRAKSLLLRTSLPIMEVARNVGIHSQQYFNYLFKKETGMSPRKYQQHFEIDYAVNRFENQIVNPERHIPSRSE